MPDLKPRETDDPRGIQEDFASPHQKTTDVGRDDPKKQHLDHDKDYSWHKFYERPKWKDFSPSEGLSDRLDGAPPPKPRRFRNVTPGEMLWICLHEAKARGVLDEIRIGFSKEKDSAGKKWPTAKRKLISHKFEPGTTVLDVIRWLDSENIAEARMDGRTLLLFPSGHGRNKTNSVTLAPGKNLIDAPEKGSAKEVVTDAYVLSESGVHGWVHDKDARKKWGRRIEAIHHINSVRTWDQAEDRGQRMLSKAGLTREQLTYGVVPDKGANPYQQYDVGDYILVMRDGAPQKQRVRQIGLVWGEDESVAIALTLGQRMDPPVVKAHKRNRAKDGRSLNPRNGSLQASFGPDWDEPDDNAPTAPSQPFVTTKAGSMQVAWDGLDENGDQPSWDQAEVEVHISDEEDFEPTAETFVMSLRGAGVVTVNDLPYNETRMVKLVAVDLGGDRSPGSEEAVASMAAVALGDLAADAVPRNLLFVGAWDPAVAYNADDAVTFEGSSYRRIVAGTTATVPSLDPVNWELIAAAGTPGDQGDPGLSAYEVWLAEGNVGTEADYLASLQGGPGDPGPPGLVWRGAWASATNYNANDAVTFGGAAYRRLTTGISASTWATDAPNWELLAAKGVDGSAGPPGLVWRGPWSNSTVYAVNDAVTYGGQVFRCTMVVGPSATAPPSDTGHWELLAAKGADGLPGDPGSPGLNWRGDWTSAASYAVNDAVTYTNNTSYRCIWAVGAGGAAPPLDTAHWAILAGPAPAVAPGSSPTPEPVGVPGAILVRLPPPSDPLASGVVDVYISETSPVNVSPGSPDYHGTSTAGALYTIEKLPNDVDLEYFEPFPDPIPPDFEPDPKVYYIVALAHNPAGAATPSAEISASMRPITGNDVSVAAVWAGTVSAARVTSGINEAEIVMAGYVESRNPLGAAYGRVGLGQADGFYSRGKLPSTTVTVTTTLDSKNVSVTGYTFSATDIGRILATATLPAETTIESVTVGTGNAVVANKATADAAGASGTMFTAALSDAPILVHFPTDGSPNIVSGILSAEQLTVTGGATFRSVTSVEPEGKLLLEQGVTPPKAPPAVQFPTYDALVLNEPTADTRHGLCKGHDGRWYTVRDVEPTGKSVIEAYDPNTGALSQSWTIADLITSSGFGSGNMRCHGRGGIVYDASRSRYYVLVEGYNLAFGESPDGWFMLTYNTAMTRLESGWDFGAGNGNIGIYPTNNKIGIGWDFGHNRVHFAYVDKADNRLRVQNYIPDGVGGFTLNGTWTEPAGETYAYDIGFAHRGDFDYAAGSDRMIFRRTGGTSSDFRVYTTSAIARVTGEEWPADGSNVRGCWWDGTNFWAYNGAGKITKHEGGRTKPTVSSLTFNADYRWFDSKTTRSITISTTAASPTIVATNYVFGVGDIGVAVSGGSLPAGAVVQSVTAGTGTAVLSANASSSATGVAATLTSSLQETVAGPRATWTQTKRAKFVLTMAAVPTGRGGVNDPDSIRVYFGTGLTPTMVKEKTLAVGVTAFTFSPSGAAEGGTAAAAFGQSTPASLESTALDPNNNKAIDLRGDGTALVEMLTPIGVAFPSMFPITAGSEPKGWYKLDGRQILGSTIPVAAAKLGTGAASKWGAAAAGFVMLPDLRGRMPIGAGTFALFGATDGTGEALRTLRHTHPISSQVAHDHNGPLHNHGAGTLQTSDHGQATNTSTGGTATRTNTAGHNITGTTGDSGSGKTSQDGVHAHGGDTLQNSAASIPYAAVDWIARLS